MSAWGGRKVAQLRTLVLACYGDRCHLCGDTGADSPDHVIPRSKGGTDDLDNLRPAHQSCNYARGDTDLAEWFAKRPLPVRMPPAPSREW